MVKEDKKGLFLFKKKVYKKIKFILKNMIVKYRYLTILHKSKFKYLHSQKQERVYAGRITRYLCLILFGSLQIHH